MLQEIGTLFKTISGRSNFSQLNRISSIVTASEVDLKLEEAANSIDTDKLDEACQHVAEAKSMTAHRQKLIKMADTSELGWRVVND